MGCDCMLAHWAGKEIASHIEEVRVVVAADGPKTLLPAGLLGESVANGNGKVEAR